MSGIDSEAAIARHRFFHCLDGIRGIAALLIVLRHTAPYFTPIRFQESYLAVDIFFLLSGVVLCNAYEQRLLTALSVRAFFLVRAIRMYPLYLLGTVIGIIPFFVVNGEASTLYHLTFSLFLIPDPADPRAYFPLNSPAWSLLFEILGNVFYAAILRFLNVKLLLGILLVSAVGLVASVFMAPDQSLDIGWTVETFPAGFFRVGFSFFAGVAICRLYKRYPVTLSGFYSNFITAVVLCLVFRLLISAPSASIRPFVDIALVLVVFPALILCAIPAQPDILLARICQFFGAISYAVYAIHEPLARLMLSLLEKSFDISVQATAPLSGMVFLVFLIVLCWALDLFYDVPVRRWLTSGLGARPVVAA
jgi:peptidoglycan/LPS O-acetylase OafA/YrhL